jgi:ubiquinone/menaquinone biosynthesis C-methylase UbiE
MPSTVLEAVRTAPVADKPVPANALRERTRAHYDDYPFIEGGPDRIAWWRGYLEELLPDRDIRGRSIVDIGSGVGEIARGLRERGADVTCLDVSGASLRRCREINPGAPVLQASALDLPFPDRFFDHVISIGVLHHTPDCRLGFHEAARVAKPGGRVVVFLYNARNVYRWVYAAWGPIRRRWPLECAPLFLARALQPFARAHLRQRLSEKQLLHLLGDKLWTPQATFHSVSEVRQWGAEEGLRLERIRPFFLGYANVFGFRKL